MFSNVSYQTAHRPLSRIWNIISIGDQRCHDVRAACLLGKSLVLGNFCSARHSFISLTCVVGAARQAILLPDIQAGWTFDVLPTGSDVLAVHQTEVRIAPYAYDRT